MRHLAGRSLVVGLALVVALVLVVLAAAPSSSSDDPSSRVSGKAGTLALYSWLSTLGFSTHRVSNQFNLSHTDVLLVVEPTAQLTAADAAAVLRLLDSGGDVVLALSPATVELAQPLLSALHVSLDIERAAGDSTPAEPFDAGDRVHHVPMALGLGIDPAPYLTPLLRQGDVLTAAAEQVGGGGRAYVVASPFPFSNDGLRDGDSALLVLTMLERARGGAIGFDEYHHGEQASAVGGATAIFESPLGLALALAALALLAYVAVSGRRVGPPIASRDTALVPTTASYLTAMARLYARSRDRGVVADRYADELKQRVGGHAGIDASLGDDLFTIAAGRCRPELAGELGAVLARARNLARERPGPATLLTLARDVDALERRWGEPVVTAPATPQWRP